MEVLAEVAGTGGSGSVPDGSGDDDRGGGGGSGWVYTEANFNTWKNGNATDASKYTLNSAYYLTSASTISGNASMPSTSGGTETGHSGNGYVRITYVP